MCQYLGVCAFFSNSICLIFSVPYYETSKVDKLQCTLEMIIKYIGSTFHNCLKKTIRNNFFRIFCEVLSYICTSRGKYCCNGVPLAALSILDARAHCWLSMWPRVNHRGTRLITKLESGLRLLF